MTNAAVMCLYRTIGTDRQIVTVMVENSSDYDPDVQYGICNNSANSLKSVAGVSSAENYTKANFTLGDANGENKTLAAYVDILCTFKTDNRGNYVTISLEKINPKSGADNYGNIPISINSAMADLAGQSGYTNWVLISCCLRFYVNYYAE